MSLILVVQLQDSDMHSDDTASPQDLLWNPFALLLVEVLTTHLSGQLNSADRTFYILLESVEFGPWHTGTRH